MELPIERSKGCRLSVYEDPLENKEIIRHKNKKIRDDDLSSLMKYVITEKARSA